MKLIKGLNLFIFFTAFLIPKNAVSINRFITDSSQMNKNKGYLTYYAHTGLKPGLCYVYEYPVFKNPVFFMGTDSSGNPKAKWSLNFQTNVALYRHKKNHIGLHINEALVLRYTGFFMFEAGAGIGLLRAFFPTALYEYQDDGTFRKRNLAGRTFITNKIMAGAGIRISKKKSRYLFGRPSLYLIYPYNNFLNIGYSFETGLLIKL